MNVLVIPEDFTKDQYVLKPIMAALMEKLGKPRVTIEVCRDPRLRGIQDALDWDTIQGIIDRYSYRVDLFLLCVDRDGEATHRARLDHIEAQSSAMLRDGQRLLGENAWQEVEVWVLAGHDLPAGWSWQEVRREVNPKERYFLPFARQHGMQDRLGGGRKALAEAAARRYDRIRQLCPEDVGALERRIKEWIQEVD